MRLIAGTPLTTAWPAMRSPLLPLKRWDMCGLALGAGSVNSMVRPGLPISSASYDSVNRILYIATQVFICSSTAGSNAGFTTVSYDLHSGAKIATGDSSIFWGGTILGRYFYQATLSVNGAWRDGYRSVWRDGQPWFSSRGWADGGGPIDFDPKRQRFYEVTAGGLRVFDAETMDLMFLAGL